MNHAHGYDLKSCLVRQIMVGLLVRVLFTVLNEGSGNQEKLNPLSSTTLWALDLPDVKTIRVSIENIWLINLCDLDNLSFIKIGN